MEKRAPKPDPISSIPCDEGGKRHIKGCPHKKEIPFDMASFQGKKTEPKPVWAGTMTWTTREADMKGWDKDRWQYEYLRLLEGNLRTVSRHRAILAGIIVALAIIAAVK